MAARAPDVASLNPGITIDIATQFHLSVILPPIYPPRNAPVNGAAEAAGVGHRADAGNTQWAVAERGAALGVFAWRYFFM